LAQPKSLLIEYFSPSAAYPFGERLGKNWRKHGASKPTAEVALDFEEFGRERVVIA
jgi:hypothetical protein